MKYFSLNKSIEENKHIYFKLSKELHPDINSQGDEKFKELKQYWEEFQIIHKHINFIKKELQLKPEKPKVVYVDRPVIYEKKIIDENILKVGLGLAKEVNKIIKNLSSD